MPNARNIDSNPRSTVSIVGHPIHPMLIPFPIAFFVTTFVSDLAFQQTGNPFWAVASLWLLGAGLVMAGLAAVVGLIDVVSEPRIQALRDTWWHAGGNILAVLLALYNWYLRYTAGDTVVTSTELILSLVVVLLLLFTGWKGWNLVYRYRVGVAD
jgi:uncharacterized membrane protein